MPLLEIITDCFTIVASGIVIYVFCMKRRAISPMLRALEQQSVKATINELYGKIDELNDLNASAEEQREDVRLVLSDVLGQLRGNPRLRPHCTSVEKAIQMQDHGAEIAQFGGNSPSWPERETLPCAHRVGNRR